MADNRNVQVMDDGEAVYMGDGVFMLRGQKDELGVPQSFAVCEQDLRDMLTLLPA